LNINEFAEFISILGDLFNEVLSG